RMNPNSEVPLFRFRKYEDLNPPRVEDFCYITDNTYTKKEVSWVFPKHATHTRIMTRAAQDKDSSNVESRDLLSCFVTAQFKHVATLVPPPEIPLELF
ncbi:unnamed protein product, partial [Linum tenue]